MTCEAIIKFDAVCQMNKNFNQAAGQVAHKSYPSCVVMATDIAMDAYITKAITFTCPQDRLLKV